MLRITIQDEKGNVIMTDVLEVRDGVNGPTFKSGSRGYYFGGKATIPTTNGEPRKHQLSLNFVEIGSGKAKE